MNPMKSKTTRRMRKGEEGKGKKRRREGEREREGGRERERGREREGAR